jgi:hypothetical protein
MGAGSPPFLTWSALLSYDDVRAALGSGAFPPLAAAGIRTGEGAGRVLAAWLIGTAAQAAGAFVLARPPSVVSTRPSAGPAARAAAPATGDRGRSAASRIGGPCPEIGGPRAMCYILDRSAPSIPSATTSGSSTCAPATSSRSTWSARWSSHLFRTFCAPRISALLDRTGEFLRRALEAVRRHRPNHQRPDEPRLRQPPGRGRPAADEPDHGRFAITNDDYLYVLSTFVFEPVRWIGRFGWRPLSDTSGWPVPLLARVGHRMGIHGIPADAEAFERLNFDY